MDLLRVLSDDDVFRASLIFGCSSMLAHRLDKLETDLQLLISIHDLFLESDTESVIDADDKVDKSNIRKTISQLQQHRHQYHPSSDDIPERDTTNSKKTECRVKKSVEFEKPKTTEGSSMTSQRDFETAFQTDYHKEIATLQEILEKERSHRQDLEHERAVILEDLERERCLRKETEDSAKQVYIQLQKTEESLDKEKEMKKDLLLDFLQVKENLELSRSEITRLHTDFSGLKKDLENMEGKMSTVSREKANLVQKLLYICQDLGFKPRDHWRRSGIGEDDSSGEECLEFLREHFKRRVDESGYQEQIRKLTGQLNTLVGRCATLEKERNSLKTSLNDASDRESHLKNQLHMCQITVTSAESDMLKKQIEYECRLQKLTSTLQDTREKFSNKIEEYSAAIKRSRELLLNLRDERDKSIDRLRGMMASKEGVEQELKQVTSECHRWRNEEERLRRKLEESRKEIQKKNGEWLEEKRGLEGTLRRYSGERRKLLEVTSEMKRSLISMKQKVEQNTGSFSAEKEAILGEKRRLEENLQVLKKISEDQGHTIGKLRGELDEMKEKNFKLDGELREYESRENQLIRRLETEEKQGQRYLLQMEELEKKIQRYGEELRGHDCQEYVDSKWKNRAQELEEVLEEKVGTLERKLGEVVSEREEATDERTKLLGKLEEMRKGHQQIIEQVKTKFQEEIKRLTDAWRKRDEERVQKICHLQSELDRLTSSALHLQRALSTKIKQLQAALGICLGGSTSSTNPNPHLLNPNPIYSFPPPPHQQIHQNHPPPVAAFSSGNSNGYSFNPNNIPSSTSACSNLLNVDGGNHQSEKSQSHTCFTFEGGGGNQNPSPPSSQTLNEFCSCTSAAPNTSQPYTTTTGPLFSVDFIDSLII